MKHTLNLERVALGELDPKEAAQIDAALHAAGEGALEDHVRDIQTSNAAILERLPPAEVAAEVARRATLPQTSSSRSFAPRLQWALGTSVAAACAVAMLVVWNGNVDDDAAGASVRAKGAALGVVLESDSGAILPTGSLARPGDQLMVRIQPGEFAFVHVVSVDGSGAVTHHFPLEGQAGAVMARGTFALPNAFELDAAPAFERFFVVGAQAPIVRGAVDAAVQALVSTGAAKTRALIGASTWTVEDHLVLKP